MAGLASWGAKCIDPLSPTFRRARTWVNGWMLSLYAVWPKKH